MAKISKANINGTEYELDAYDADTVDSWHAAGVSGYSIKKSGYINSQTSGLSSYWAKMASFTFNGQYNDQDITLWVHSAYNNLRGLIHIKARADSTSSFSVSLVQVIGNLTATNFRLYYQTDSLDGTVELWGNTGGQYNVYNYLLLSETGRVYQESATVTLTRTIFSTVQTPSLTTYVTMSNLTATTSSAGMMSAADKEKLDSIEESANSYSLPLATSITRGGVKIGYVESGKNYPVQLSNEQMYVNVPWTDTDTTYSAGTGLSLSGTVFSLKTATSSERGGVKTGYTTDATAGNYKLNVDSSGNGYVTVPVSGTYSAGTGLYLSDTVFSLKPATTSEIGGIKLGYTTSGRSYRLMTDSSNNGYVTVPWSDTLNTVGATNSTSKLYLVGATSQSSSVTSNTNESFYIEDGELYANGSLVVNKSNLSSVASALGYNFSLIGGKSGVQSITAGIGLTTAEGEVEITDEGTINLKTATQGELGGIKPYYYRSAASTGPTASQIINSVGTTVNSRSSTSGRYYPLEMDVNGRAFTNVPWTDTTYSLATSTSDGLMSSEDFTKLGNIAEEATKVEYTPVLTSGIAIATIKVTSVEGGETQTIYAPSATPDASSSTAGLMSASDKAKLDGITASADAVSWSGSSSYTSSNSYALGTLTINGTANTIYSPQSVSYATSAGSATSATTATKATQDGNGNTISSYYMPYAGGSSSSKFALTYTPSVAAGVWSDAASFLAPNLATTAAHNLYVGKSLSTGNAAYFSFVSGSDYNSLRLGFYGGTSSTSIRLGMDGLVGIGTVSPSYKLDVNGTIGASSDILAKKATSSDGIRVSAQNSTTGTKVSLHVGSAGYNHGLYSDTAGTWMVYTDSSGNTYLNGNATTSSYPSGFSASSSSATWGVQTGTCITDWSDGSGGDIAFRKNCPASGQTSVVIDGYFYQKEGWYRCLDTSDISYTSAVTGSATTIGTLTVGDSTITLQTPTINTYELGEASSDNLGGIKIGYTENGQNYPVELDSSNKAYVNVPWTDNNTTYSAGTGLTLSDTTFSLNTAKALTLGGIVPWVWNASECTSNMFSRTSAVAIRDASSVSGRYFPVEVDSVGHPYVNVPLTCTANSSTTTKYLLGTATVGDFSMMTYNTSIYTTGDNIYAPYVYGTSRVSAPYIYGTTAVYSNSYPTVASYSTSYDKIRLRWGYTTPSADGWTTVVSGVSGRILTIVASAAVAGTGTSAPSLDGYVSYNDSVVVAYYNTGSSGSYTGYAWVGCDRSSTRIQYLVVYDAN